MRRTEWVSELTKRVRKEMVAFVEKELRGVDGEDATILSWWLVSLRRGRVVLASYDVGFDPSLFRDGFVVVNCVWVGRFRRLRILLKFGRQGRAYWFDYEIDPKFLLSVNKNILIGTPK